MKKYGEWIYSQVLCRLWKDMFNAHHALTTRFSSNNLYLILSFNENLRLARLSSSKKQIITLRKYASFQSVINSVYTTRLS